MSVVELLAASPALFTGTCLVLGLAVGSFLNVVIYRLPVMLDRQWRAQCAELAGHDPHATTVAAGPRERFDLVVPRSACPACKAPITAWQNIPLVSWVLLRGRCARCRVWTESTHFGTKLKAVYRIPGQLALDSGEN